EIRGQNGARDGSAVARQIRPRSSEQSIGGRTGGVPEGRVIGRGARPVSGEGAEGRRRLRREPEALARKNRTEPKGGPARGRAGREGRGGGRESRARERSGERRRRKGSRNARGRRAGPRGGRAEASSRGRVGRLVGSVAGEPRRVQRGNPRSQGRRG